MACLGMRETSDIDVISDIQDCPYATLHNSFIERWSEYKQYELILCDPMKTFWMTYKGCLIRVLDINILRAIKLQRHRVKEQDKDLQDIHLLNKLIG